MAAPLDRILRDSKIDNLIQVLAEHLSPTDLQTLLLTVYRDRATKIKPARLLEQYEENRFVAPSSVSPLAYLELDRLAFSLASPLFQPIELSPVCPLGTSSSLSKVSQNNIVATARNTEVVSDSTNCMALALAVQRRELLRQGRKVERVRLCSSHRLLRAQTFSGPSSFAHFRVFALCTAGRDEGGYRFEYYALREHIDFYLRLLSQFETVAVRLAVTDFAGTHAGGIESEVLRPISEAFPNVQAGFDPERVAGRGYYDDLCFQVFATDSVGVEYNLVDGGVTNWTQQLLSNGKERLMISGIGSERTCALFQRRDSVNP